MDRVWSQLRAGVDNVGSCILAAGAAGGAVGATSAALQGTSIPVSIAAVSVNFAMFACAFLGINGALVAARGGEDDYQNWALAGGATGGFFTYGVIPHKTVRGTLVFGAAAAGAKVGLDYFGQLMDFAREQRLSELQRESKSEVDSKR